MKLRQISISTCLLCVSAFPAAQAGTPDETCRRADDRNQRVTACTQLIQTSKDRAILLRAHNTRGLALCSLDRCVEAVPDFEAVLKINSSIAGFYDNYARALREARRFDEALRAQNHAIQMAPKYAFLYFGKAMILEAKGDQAEALKVDEEAIKAEPNNAGAWEYKGKLLGLLGRFTEAYAAFDRTLQIEPSRSHVLITRADVERLQGRTEAALADLQRHPASGDSYKEVQDKIAEINGIPIKPPLTVRLVPELLLPTKEISLEPDHYWVVLASRQDLDQAIGAAEALGGPKAKVLRAVNGWYAAVSGPHQVPAGQGPTFLEKEKKEHGAPLDAFLSSGTGFDKIVWDPPKDNVLVTLDYDGEHDAATQLGDIRLEISRKAVEKDSFVPVLTGFVKGKRAFSEELGAENPNEKPSAQARLVRLDLGNSPAVVFTYYWQGAHCCTLTKIISTKQDSAWASLSIGPLDGDGLSFEDLDGRGFSYLVSVDQNFLYAFASYAGSFAPIQIQQFKDGGLADVTRETFSSTPSLARYVSAGNVRQTTRRNAN